MNLASARTNLVLGALVLLLTAAAGWLVLLGPTQGDIGAARQQLTDRTDANALLAVRLKALEKQAADLSEVHSTARELAAVFPPTADQPGFFALMDAAAAEAGIAPEQITTLSPTAPLAVGADPAAAPAPPTEPVDAPLAVQAVTVTLTTSYDRARRLLGRLEEMDRAFLVQSVTVATEGSGGGNAASGGTTTVTITGNTFVAPPVVRPRQAADGGGIDTAGG
jgi:hypothetical protein